MPTLVQSKFGVNGGTSVAVAFTSNTTTGNTILAFGVASNSQSANLTFSDGNGSYTRDNQQSVVTAVMACAHSAVIVSGGATTVTMASTVNTTLGLTIQEWAGLNSSPFDQVTTIATGTGTTQTGGASGTLGASGGVFVGWTNATASTTWTAGSGFSLDPASSNPSGRVVEYQIPSSTSPITPSTTTSGSVTWAINGAYYLPAPVVVGQLPPQYSRKYIIFNT